MNTLELQRQITTFLTTKAIRVYFEGAPDNAVYPYIVYNLVSSNEMLSNREDFDLEIDIWDNSSDTTNIETITGNIDGDGNVFTPSGLHRKMWFINGFSAKCYRINRLIIPDEDKRIRRRQLKYIIHSYLGG